MEFLIGLILGTILGFSGAGGTVFAVPLLMWLLGMPISEAMGTALGAVSASAIYGVICQREKVQWTQGCLLACAGILTAPIGRWVALSINENWLIWGFCGLAGLISIVMWRQTRITQEEPESDDCCELIFIESIPQEDSKFIANISGGLAVGFLSGLLGIGGGLFIVPFIRCLTRLSLDKSIATSLFVIAIISGSGFSSHLVYTNDINIVLLLKIIVAGIAGLIIGQKVSRLYNKNSQQKTLAVLLALVSCVIFVNKILFV